MAFAIPRKEIVKEIYQRLKEIYPELIISCVYGGNHENLTGDIVVLTTHQLYRYCHDFDLLILDEADAFPYSHNSLLEHFLKRAGKDNFIFLSATISSLPNMQTVNIMRRYHQHDLPLPKIVLLPTIFHHIALKKVILKTKAPLLIFVPTIAYGKQLEKKLNYPFIYAEKEEKGRILQQFIQKRISVLITTSILERGVTIENVQVVVMKANHPIFSCASLIQICGRVGRKMNYPHGKIIYICNKLNKEIKQSYRELKKKNQASV